MTDLLFPFMIKDGFARGSCVRLSAVPDEAFSRRNYPNFLARLLSESFALTAVVASAFKFEGIFTFQIQGTGPVSMLVIDSFSRKTLRAYVRFDEARLKTLLDKSPAPSIPAVFGPGTLSMTIDPEDRTMERYQGVVALEQETLADCVQEYFRRSEQLECALKVEASVQPDGRFVSGACMIQKMPAKSLASKEEDEDLWRESVILLSSLKKEELLDKGLDVPKLLNRLYHAHDLTVFTPKPFVFECRCSQERAEGILNSLPPSEKNDIDEEIKIVCEFCGKEYTVAEKI